jgi:hypothetical protein
VGPRGYLDWYRENTARTMIQTPNQPGRSESLYPYHEPMEIEVHLHTTLSTRRTSVVNTLPPNNFWERTLVPLYKELGGP